MRERERAGEQDAEQDERRQENEEHVNPGLTTSNLTFSVLVFQSVPNICEQLGLLLIHLSGKLVCDDVTNNSLRSHLIACANTEQIKVAGVNLR